MNCGKMADWIWVPFGVVGEHSDYETYNISVVTDELVCKHNATTIFSFC